MTRIVGCGSVEYQAVYPYMQEGQASREDLISEGDSVRFLAWSGGKLVHQQFGC